MQTKIAERYFFFTLLLATFVFTFLIFRPFWVVLVLGVSFSIVLYPLYEKLKKSMANWVASLLTVSLFAVALCGPLLGIGVLIFNQSQDLYHSIGGDGHIGPFLESLGENVNKLLPEGVGFDIEQKASEFIEYTTGQITDIFSATLSAFFSFVLMLLIIFYFLKDGVNWKRAVIVLSPLSDRDDEKIISRLSKSINVVIKGSLLIALIQGFVMGMGLFIFGVPNAALWGVVAAVCSLIPTVGTALVSVPAVIYLFVTDQTGFAIGLLAWAIFAVGLIDNFLRPYIVGEKINIPPLLILFSVLGGISF